ncbi:FMN-binding negative transcriptional regulator [Nocardia sp. NPDC060256]|uniref:FMN-binding negative transcriptional regulator n=1 Tax=unclassified Nocardia TaxID=2637762 RepID=UPI00364AC3F4
MMFVPKEYRRTDPSWTAQLIRQHALACLVTNGEPWPLATHVPIIVDPTGPVDTDDPAGLVGARLLGHLNRGNPHWRTLRAQQSALLVFQGPNGYVSPTVYQTTPAAPTWDFTSVHIRGTLDPIEDAERTLEIVRQTVTTFEHDLGSGWDMTESLRYFGRLLPGVGAFQFTVHTVDGMFKLSQEQQPQVRNRVAASFAASQCAVHQALAEYIRRAG